MSDIKVGDRVKVEHTYEAVVRYVSKYDDSVYDVTLRGGGVITTGPDDVVTKLVEPLKVGDTIEGSDAYEALPLGAVVADTGGDVNLRTLGGFIDSDGSHFEADELSAARTLVYLPA